MLEEFLIYFHSRDLFRLLKCPVSPHFNALYSLESLARKGKTLTLILYLSRNSDLTHPELAIIYGDQKAEPFLLTTPPLRFLTKLLPSTVCLADPTSNNKAPSRYRKNHPNKSRGRTDDPTPFDKYVTISSFAGGFNSHSPDVAKKTDTTKLYYDKY